MRSPLITVPIIVLSAIPSIFAQAAWAPAAGTPRIAINLPATIPSEGLWIRYLLKGKGSSSHMVRPQPHVRQYVIYRNPTQEAKIAAYAPGCEFKAYSLPAGDYDVSVPFTCEALPVFTLHGFLPPAQIPPSMFKGTNLLIVAELEADWVCDYFLFERRPGTSDIMGGGSCLSAPTPLGIVGELDPRKNGSFDITLPDFTRDPLFKNTAEMPRLSRFGIIELELQDKTVRRPLGGIKPENADTTSGLMIQDKYPDPVKFTTLR
ncbi:MAG TPA: hypothetical protein VKT29_16835 [Terriglobales bacterium]|nr:hypothetical protein [Terriglobales bacterium]